MVCLFLFTLATKSGLIGGEETNSSWTGRGEWRSWLPSVVGTTGQDSRRTLVNRIPRRRGCLPGCPINTSQRCRNSSFCTRLSTVLGRWGLSEHIYSMNGWSRLGEGPGSGLGNEELEMESTPLGNAFVAEAGILGWSKYRWLKSRTGARSLRGTRENYWGYKSKIGTAAN